MKGALIEIVARAAGTLAPVTLRMASVDDSRVCHLNDTVWWPAISKLPKLSYDLFSGEFDGQVGTPASNLSFACLPFDGAPALRYAGAPVRIWTGDVGAPFDSWIQRFDGRVKAQPSIDAGIATASIAVDDAWLDQPVLGTYAGTGGAEGSADLKGTAKPLALGAPRYASGVLVDVANSVVQISGAGPIAAVEAALDKLSRFPASVADYPDHAALVAATIPAGRFATCLAEGKVRHGAPPEGTLSYLVKGDTGGRSSGYPRYAGELIRRIADIVGAGDRVDQASLDALDALRPMPLSIQVTAQTTARELIQRIAQSVNAVAGVSWLGKLFVARIGAIGDVMATLQADGSALPPVSSVKQLENGTPWWRVDIKAQPTWTVHALSDIAFAAPLTPRGLYVAGTTYREGDIVDLLDGSRWLYLSTTPGTGALPGPDWYQMSPAIQARYADGTTIEEWKPAELGSDITKSLDLSDTVISISTDASGATVAGQLPASVKATRRRGGADVSAATDFSIVIAGSITATIDNDPASIARGTVTITAVQSSGTIQIVSNLDGAVLPGTVTINLPDAVAPPPTDASASLTSFPTIKSRTPTYPSAPTSFVSAKADSAGRISMVLDVTYYFRNEGSPAFDYGSLTAATRLQYRPTGGASWTDAAAEIVGTEAYRQGNTTTGKIDVVQGRLNTGVITVSGLTPNAIYDAAPLLRAQPVAASSKGQGDPAGAFTVRTGL